MAKRVEVGIVTKAGKPKFRRVEVTRMMPHGRYGKYIRHRTICYVHDENDESGIGDRVEIVESRPLSRLKRWRLVRVIEKAGAVDKRIAKGRDVEQELQAVVGGDQTESEPSQQGGDQA
ncbi:small ribosomal subunit protein uS17 [Thermopirellula anaerolimosa]